MKFLVLNRLQAEKFMGVLPYVHISIRDTNSQPAQLLSNGDRIAELSLEFSDIDDKGRLRCLKKPESVVSFTKEDAKLILDFFNKWKYQIHLIVVNCEAGIGRGSAVAAALSNIYGQDDNEFFKHYRPNMLVYRTILEEYYKED